MKYTSFLLLFYNSPNLLAALIASILSSAKPSVYSKTTVFLLLYTLINSATLFNDSATIVPPVLKLSIFYFSVSKEKSIFSDWIRTLV
jgi:hypothetical protein